MATHPHSNNTLAVRMRGLKYSIDALGKKL